MIVYTSIATSYHFRSVLATYGVFNRNGEPSGNSCTDVPSHTQILLLIRYHLFIAFSEMILSMLRNVEISYLEIAQRFSRSAGLTG